MDKINYEHYAIIMRLLEREQDNLLTSIKEMNKRKDINIDTYETYVAEANTIKDTIEVVRHIMKGLK